ncbi:MAG: uL15 family ribosomal protein [Conexivisphaerales archaeon]
MPTRFRKIRKMRGSRTVGWGQVNQHRKHGAKGGHGHAGLHKHKWSWVVTYAPDYFGSHGFAPIRKRKQSWVNVGQLEEIAARMEEVKKLGTQDGLPVIDLVSMGVNKLLGAGNISRALLVKVSYCTGSAKDKVEKAGGKVQEV